MSTEQLKIDLPQDTWVKVISDTDSCQFTLTNYPNETNKRLYLLTYSILEPTSGANYLAIEMQDKLFETITFANESITNIWVKSSYSDGEFQQ